MSTRPALVTGATGLLGRQITASLRDAGHTVIGTGLSRATPPLLRLDLTDTTAIAQTIADVNPSIVVHCAANRNPDACAREPSSAHAINVSATAALAHAAAQIGALMVYISTDYVFSGAPGEAPYAASAATGPTNVYGLTKLEGEKAVAEAYMGKGGRAVVLRLPVLYGKAEREGESAVNGLVGAVWKVQREEVRMDHWARRFPTNTEDVGRVVGDIVELYTRTLARGEKGEIERLPEILQFSSEDCYTKYEMCEVFAEILGLGLEKMVKDMRGNETGVKRPFDCHLGTEELRRLGIRVHTVDFRGWWRWELRAVRH